MAPRKETVFLQYSQDELDQAYDQRVWAENAAEVIARYASASAAVRARLAFRPGLPYGPGGDEVLDLFPANRANAPVHIHIHGGAWRLLGKDDASYPAPTFVEAGIHYVTPHFTNLPQATLPEMVEQIRTVIAWVYANAKSFGGDPDRITLSGHSSGAHLAAVLLTTDWVGRGLPLDVIKAGLCVSGVFDLEPVLLSARSAYVRLEPRAAHALSPIRHVGQVRCPIIVCYAERESPEFVRQGRSFAAALSTAGRKVDLLVDREANHFEIIESLGRPDGLLARAALAQIGAL